MKNIFSKTTENRTQNGVKSYLCPTFVLYTISIFAFLTLGVGQMRGATTVNGGYIYFDEYNSGYTGAGDMQFWIGHNTYSCAYSMSKISNTKLWYCQASSWGDATYFAFTSGANWGCADQKYYDRIGSNTWKSAIKESYTLNSGSYYVFKVASTANKAAVNSASPYGYQGNAVTSLNKTITVKAKVSTDGGGNYKEETSPGTLSASSYKFTDYNSCASATSLSSGTISCGYTATTTLTATDATGYDFVGWYNASGVQQTTSKTLTIYPTEDAIYYAFFKRKQFTVNFEPKGTFGTSTVTAAISAFSISSGSQQNYGSKITFTASPAKGYFVEGWYSDAECTVPLDNGQKTTYRISSLEANSSVYVKFMPFTISATMTPTTGATGVAQDFSFNITSNAPLNSGYYVGVYNFGEVGSGEHGNGEMNGIVRYNSSPTIYSRTGVVGFASAGIYTTQAFLMKESNVLATSEKITYTVGAGDSFTVSFNMNGHGDAVEPQNISSGKTAKAPSPEPTATGYTFGGWYENSECIGSAFNFNTPITANKPLYAKWTENMTTVTINVNPASAGTLTLDGNAFTPGNTTTAGVSTSHTVVATAQSGKVFINWSTSGNATGSSVTNTYTLHGNGNSATGTLTANFGVSTGWYLEGQDFGGWGSHDCSALPTSYPFANPYRDQANTYYIPVMLTDGHYFKVHNGDGCSNVYNFGSNSDNVTVSKNTVYSLTVDAAHSGTVSSTMSNVWAVLNTSTKKFWVQDSKTYYTITLANGSSGDTDNGVAGTEGTVTLTTNDLGNLQTKQFASGERVNISVSAQSGYYIDDITIGGNSVATDINTTSYSGNTAMPASNTTLTVTYKRIYPVTYGVGTGYTSMGGVSTEQSISSGSYVIEGTEITFTATPNLGYKFVGWYNNAECTGNAVSTDASYTIASLSADTYLYAKFDYRPLYIHADWLSWGTAAMTQSTENRAVYTYTYDNMGVLASGQVNGNWDIGYHFRIMKAANGDNQYLAYNYDGVQTPTYTATIVDGVHKTAEKNETIEFGLTKKSYITITLTLQEAEKPTVNIAADPYYTVSTATGGSGAAGITINPTSVEARSGANSAEITATIAPGYTFTNWTAGNTITITSPNATTTTVRATGEGTLTANATANSYTVHFDGNGNTGGLMNDMPALTYGVAFKLTANAFTKTGYTFAGWATSADGEVVYRDEEEVSNLTDVNNGTATLYAKWTPNKYTVTLDKQTSEEGYGGSEGTVANQTVTFDATPATVSGIRLTAKNGWAFMGFYSATGGNGRCFIDPSGNWVTDAGDTIRESKWVHAGDVTLYAYYKKAEITDLIFDAAVVAPSASVGVTPKVDPTPEGTNSICWKLLYNNGNLYTPQPEFRPKNPGGVDNKVTFNAPNTSGMYLVAAVLRTGTDCNGGTKLDSVTYPFQVAGDHTVTVQYKCGNTTIKASTSATGKPLEWTAITAPEIVGYSFSKWKAGDGITIDGADGNGEKADATINFKAIYGGQLTAVYTSKRMIYFNNTLGWKGVTVYFYKNASYWNNDNGAGADNTYEYTNTPYSDGKHGDMTQIEGTNIWYFDLDANEVPANLTTVNFTELNQHGYGYFAETGNVKNNVAHPCNNAALFNVNMPMYVPIDDDGVWKNDGKAKYYSNGYWMNYPNYSGYTLKIYNTDNRNTEPTAIKSFDFPYSDAYVLPMSVDVDLEANKKYYFDVYRNDNTLFGNNGDMKYGNSGPWSFFNTDTRRAGITTTAAGNYRFTWSFFKESSTYNYHMTVTYPVAPNDYRVIYTDNATWTKAHTLESWYHPSRIITAEENAVDTISFFVSKGHSPEFKIQKVNTIDAGTGAIEWTDVTNWTSCNDVEASGVYNFIFTQDGSKNIRFTKKEPYTGNFYIRTDAAGSTKWDNYRAADHLMTYSEYSKDHSDYTHYFVKFVRKGTNVKFVVANDYSPCISDTLIQSTYRGSDASHVDAHGFLNNDLPGDGVNVRFMWDIRNNAVMRAYLAPAQSDGSNFLVLRGTDSDNLKDENGNPLRNASNSGQDGYNHKAPDYCIQFVDNENWIYEATVQVVPSSYVKLYAFFHGDNFYYKGTEDDRFDDTHAIKLVEGSGKAVKVRVIYDFKTDRLVAAYLPSGNIDEEMAINADVMFIREHQGDIEQLTFSEKDSKMGAITEIKTAYAVMRFNKWTLNNKEKTGEHTPLASPASIYERSLYYVSFPFPVNLSEVFGFGTYGQDWIIQRYRGDLRAQQGFWAESDGFWEFIWNRNGVVLQPNEGYILTLETELLGEESDVWGPDQRSNQIELFFPSTGPLGSITNASVTQKLPKHTCTIDKTKDQFGNLTGLQDSPDPSTSYNRTIFDSHWNIMSVPTYVNVNNPSFANTTWIANESCPKFLYTWNMDDNTLTATSGKGFMYHAMHAYTVQYHGEVTWTTSVTPTAAPQRNTEYRGEYEFCLEVQQDEQMIDRTFVRLSDDENVTTGFEFSEDMTKQFNSRKANIFTIAGNTSLGGNSLPLSTTQTTVVPVGVKIKTAGDYTFSIPEGTEGIGVTLVDNETGVRTLLSALDYTVNLAAGDYTERFWLEISPIQNTPTGIEEPTSDSSLKGRAQKRIIDGVLYIVKDGKIFDARGTRVE